MTTYENECCDCKASGYPCKGPSCPALHVRHVYCDRCGDEAIGWYEYDHMDLCQECLLDLLKKREIIREVNYDDDPR